MKDRQQWIDELRNLKRADADPVFLKDHPLVFDRHMVEDPPIEYGYLSCRENSSYWQRVLDKG